MDQHGRKPHDRVAIPIQAEWQHGARTAAWDALWRRILTDLDHDLPGAEQGPAIEPSTRPENDTATPVDAPIRRGGAA